MNSADFNLTADPTTLFASDLADNKKVFTVIVSNETDTEKSFTLEWGSQVIKSGTVASQGAVSLFDNVYFVHEAGEHLFATGEGLTLHMVYGNHDG